MYKKLTFPHQQFQPISINVGTPIAILRLHNLVSIAMGICNFVHPCNKILYRKTKAYWSKIHYSFSRKDEPEKKS